VVAGLVVIGGAVSIASASSRGAGAEKGRTLRFRTTVVSSSVKDAGHAGVADVTAVLFSLQTASGPRPGRGQRTDRQRPGRAGVIDRSFHLLPRHH
jgi:hypothetical protein